MEAFDFKFTHMALDRPQVLVESWPEVSVPCHIVFFIWQLTTWQLDSVSEQSSEFKRAGNMEGTVFL